MENICSLGKAEGRFVLDVRMGTASAGIAVADFREILSPGKSQEHVRKQGDEL